MAMKRVFVFILVTLIIKVVFSQTMQEYVILGNDQYNHKNYANAVETYQKILEKGLESPKLYFNLGNAYYKLKNYPKAILFYEKAHKLDPSDEKINFNLDLVNTKIQDKIEALPQPFYRRWFMRMNTFTSTDGWAISGIVFLFLLAFFVAVFLVADQVKWRKMAFVLGLLCVFSSTLSFVHASVQYSNIEAASHAIILNPVVDVCSSPDAGSQHIFVIHEGTKVVITDKVGNWLNIKIANGSDGWVQEDVLERI